MLNPALLCLLILATVYLNKIVQIHISFKKYLNHLNYILRIFNNININDQIATKKFFDDLKKNLKLNLLLIIKGIALLSFLFIGSMVLNYIENNFFNYLVSIDALFHGILITIALVVIQK